MLPPPATSPREACAEQEAEKELSLSDFKLHTGPLPVDVDLD